MLPIFPGMTMDQADEVAAALTAALDANPNGDATRA
jgi:dTDP-4-amino-4,6-dideoxygalactose transaminase